MAKEITLVPRTDEELRPLFLRAQSNYQNICKHPQLEVDPVNHIITCVQCQKEVDAWWAMWKIAGEQICIYEDILHYKELRAQEYEKLQELKREVSNERAKLKRLKNGTQVS